MTGFPRTLAQVGAFFLLLAATPWMLTNDYYLSVLIMCCINGIIVVGLNMLLGYAGQISLGHAAFYGLAAYASAVATATYGLPMELGLVAAIVVTAVAALAIGIPALKLEGNYLGMATMGFGIIVYIFLNETVELTGGPSGFVAIPRLALLGYEFTSDLSYYYLTAATLAGTVLLSMNIIQSRLGRALRALHTSEKAAQLSGVNIAKYKLFVFVLSAVYASVAGFLYAHYLTFVAPSSFGFMFSVELITMVVLGGMANMWGAVAGAFFLTILPQVLYVFEEIDILVFGGILVVGMMFLPDGIAGGLQRFWRLVRRPRRASTPAPAASGADGKGGRP
ncbi:MAG: branched-chain amino acid ABC transporter permease [Desulfovibrionaceae bacterium]